MTTIKKGLDLPILGNPDQRIEVAKPVERVALLGDDYVGMKPTMLVAEGDRVKQGQPLFEDKKTPGVLFTAPASGQVASIIRGEKRRFLGLVIQVSGDDRVEFTGAKSGSPSSKSREEITNLLLQSGLWTSLRTRPYGNLAAPGVEPRSIFVTAIDTSPLAADPVVVMNERRDQFSLGLAALARLTSGKVFVCKAENASIPLCDAKNIQVESFSGPHPAGLVGTHIHFLDPVGPNRSVWYIGYQDVIAIGSLLTTGTLDVRRVVSLAGPVVRQPRLLETRLGASITELTEGEVTDNQTNVRRISGSVLSGRTAVTPHDFLGRYHQQISLIQEGNEREFLGWQMPGFDKFSVSSVFASALTPNKRFALTTSTGGSERAMVPLGTYEQVMPLDILPTQLLRALICRDTEMAQQLGALELEEEDLALCTFVCPGKYDYGVLLRDNLTTIQHEG
jgi:Na+-transporting NADH:ubiquinone oxidoreductase subunit A